MHRGPVAVARLFGKLYKWSILVLPSHNHSLPKDRQTSNKAVITTASLHFDACGCPVQKRTGPKVAGPQPWKMALTGPRACKMKPNADLRSESARSNQDAQNRRSKGKEHRKCSRLARSTNDQEQQEAQPGGNGSEGEGRPNGKPERTQCGTFVEWQETPVQGMRGTTRSQNQGQEWWRRQ